MNRISLRKMVRKSFLGLFFLFVLLTSCLPEKKLARDFVGKHPDFNLMVLVPDLVFKYNHKGEEIAGLDTLTAEEQDSVLFYNSRYMQYISDSVFLERYVNRFIDELRLLGFNVYLTASLDTFFRGMPQSYQLNIAQLQLDEYTYTHVDRYPADDSVLVRIFPLNAVDFSVWMELSKLNTDGSSKRLLYATHSVLDDFDGYFYLDPLSFDIGYRYRHDTLQGEEIYQMASAIGRRHAGYLYDFFLNQYVLYHLAPGSFQPYYYRYNRLKDQLVPTEDERFEILE